MIHVTVRQRPDREHLQLAYTCPMTGKVKTKSARTGNWDDAQRAASRWEAELEQRHGMAKMSWEVFRDRFEVEHLETKSRATASAYGHALDKFEKHVGKPRSLESITASVLSEFASNMRKENLAIDSVATYLRHVRSALGWAAKMGMIRVVPKAAIPTGAGSRGRALTHSEVIRYFVTLRKVAGPHSDGLVQLIKVCWLGGLRLAEALRLSYDRPPVRVDLNRQYPVIIWSVGGHKSKREEVIPICPDFARFLSRAEVRRGPVVQTTLSIRTIKAILTDVGRESGIQVGEEKHATAHDFRRTFGRRWALKVHPLVLKKLMRHQTMETTLKYYVDIDSDDVAKSLWPMPASDKSVHVNVHVTPPNSPLRAQAARENPHKNKPR